MVRVDTEAIAGTVGNIQECRRKDRMSMRGGKTTSEERLLRKLLQGTLFGFSDAQCEEILRTEMYRASLYRYAYRLCGDHDAADDILQRAWLELYVELKQNGEYSRVLHSDIPAWLRTVIYHAAINYRKAQQRVVSLERADGVWLLEQRADPFERPDALVMRDEIALEILGVIQRALTSRQMTVMLMFYLHESSIEEIAQRLDCPASTVKSHLRRAREQLRKAFGGSGVQARDIRLLGGLRERFDQVLSYLDAHEVPVDERDVQFARSIMGVDVKDSAVSRELSSVRYRSA
jgi:RNA polymerase sigma-70 factor, ECF subfamily